MINENSSNKLAALSILAILINTFVGIIFLTLFSANTYLTFILICIGDFLFALLGSNSDKKVEALPSICNLLKELLSLFK